ncbi:hypothetical protein HQQ80_07645 [Microbacteriaceae bacterium VKM Ac-2855]|nr:hypothetical protein [Microbacteriaceae bacterium VKM Ac-2855]
MTDPSGDRGVRRYRVAMGVVLSGFIVVASGGLVVRAVSDPTAAGELGLSVLLLGCVGALVVVATFLPRVWRSGRSGSRILVAGLLLVVGVAAMVGGIVLFGALRTVAGSDPSVIDALMR